MVKKPEHICTISRFPEEVFVAFAQDSDTYTKQKPVQPLQLFKTRSGNPFQHTSFLALRLRLGREDTGRYSSIIVIWLESIATYNELLGSW